MSDYGDTELHLSSNALDALKEFYAERDTREKQFEDLKAAAEADEKGRKIDMATFTEDWNASQFWYSQETANLLARQLLAGCTKDTTIAVVSAPSVFVELKNIISASTMTTDEIPKIHLLEYDERFNVFPEFIFYDFKYPFKLPEEIKNTIDHLIVDPPFLSEDCQSKAAMTCAWLSKSWGKVGTDGIPVTAETGKIISCTGERMQDLIQKLYKPMGVKTTTFLPEHAKGLSNEFYCYANFECDEWKWRKEDN